MSTIVTGFDIGGTKCAVSVGALRDGDIEIADRRAIETPDTWQQAVVRLFCLANELLGWQKPAACGFSCGGPLDAARGVQSEYLQASSDYLTQIRESINILKEGRIPYEFRTTVVREFHSAEDIREIAAELSGASAWYLQPFRDAPEVPRKGLHAPDKMTMEEFGSIGNRFIKTIIRN